jgi:hypothetical protein
VVVLGTNGTSSANFSVNPQPNSPVSAGNYTEFVVTFDPSAAGLRIATLSIANNDSNKNPYTFSIQGKGSSAPVALGDTYTTDEDKVLTVAVPGVLANDSDAENDPLSAILVSGVTHGKLTPNPRFLHIHSDSQLQWHGQLHLQNQR